jgi:hypothetical protein
MQPYMGIMESPQAFVMGLGKGTGKLLQGVTTGVIGSAASLVGAAGMGINSVTDRVATYTGDDKYMKRREEKMRAARSSNGGVLSGMKAGGESIVNGFASGLTGLVTRPYQEGKKSGALGVVKGMGQGLLGAATKPVMGITDGVTNLAVGCAQQMGKYLTHVRPRRALEHLEGAPPLLVKFELFAAEAQQYIDRRKTAKGYEDSYLASCTLGFPRHAAEGTDKDAPFGIALSDKCIFELTRSLHKTWVMLWTDLSHVALYLEADGNAVDFVSYKGDHVHTSLGHSAKESGCTRRVMCANRQSALRLYAVLARFAQKMGNPAQVIPIEELHLAVSSGDGLYGVSSRLRSTSDATTTSNSTLQRRGSVTSVGTVGTVAARYKFGSINVREYRFDSASEAQIFDRAKLRLSKISPTMQMEPGGTDKYAQLLDDSLWRLISEWRHNHNIVFNPSRCAGCLVINHTQCPVQFTDFELREGKDYAVFGVGDGFDKDSRTLQANGGAAIVFAFGCVPSLTDLAHVRLQVFTSAFQAVLSTRRGRTDITNQPGFHAGYVEKSQSDYWAKSVITINQL